MKFKARDYQKECLVEITQAVEQSAQRALVVMAPGLGKTITSAFAVKEFFTGREFGRVLIICHSEDILRQSKAEYQKFFGEEYSYGMFVSNEKTTRQTDFLFATFQTMKDNRKVFPKDAFSYIVVDEAHHSKARTYFPTIRYFKPEFLLGLTATPDRLDGQKIEEIYGEPVYELNFVEATCRGLLAECDYELVLDDLSQEDIDRYLDSGEKLSIAQLNNTIFAPKRDEEIVRLIKKYSTEQEDPKTMIFCKSIEHARRITKLMGDEATLVHNGQSDSANDRALNAFRDGRIRTIVSVQMLNEGINVPDANVVVFLRNTVSPSVFYQQLGRGVRPAPGKKKVKVLDFVGNCERIQTILELKQEIDDFRIQTPVEKPYVHGAGEADSREKFMLNIATPEFKARMIDIVEILGRAERGLGWTDEGLLESFKNKAIELGHTPTMEDVNSDKQMASAGTYIARFGSMVVVAKKCGLTPNKGAWDDVDDETLLAMMLKKSKNGLMPSSIEVKDDPEMPYPEIYKRRFGTWYDLSKKLGLKMGRIQAGRFEKLGEAELISVMQNEAQRNGGKPLSRAEFAARSELPAPDAYIKVFGSWNNAVKAAGLKVNQDMIDNEQAIVALVDKALELGHAPTRADVDNDESMLSSQAYANRFGTFSKALKTAGLDVGCRSGRSLMPDERKHRQEQMIADLQRFADELDKVPTQNDLQGVDWIASGETYARHFGSYKNALKKAGLVYDETTPEVILLDKLKELATKNDGKVSRSIIQSAGWRYPSVYVYTRVFGGLTKAKQQAGLK